MYLYIFINMLYLIYYSSNGNMLPEKCSNNRNNLTALLTMFLHFDTRHGKLDL